MKNSSQNSRLQIAVIGAGEASTELYDMAFRTGEALAQAGAVVVCGGRGGVMESVCAGAQSAGGRTLGILPGAGPEDSPPNLYVDTVVYTGMGQARNLCVVLSGDAAIAIGGSWGTLSEIALARKHGVPVVLLTGWEPTAFPVEEEDPGLVQAEEPADAVRRALELGALRRNP